MPFDFVVRLLLCDHYATLFSSVFQSSRISGSSRDYNTSESYHSRWKLSMPLTSSSSPSTSSDRPWADSSYTGRSKPVRNEPCLFVCCACRINSIHTLCFLIELFSHTLTFLARKMMNLKEPNYPIRADHPTVDIQPQLLPAAHTQAWEEAHQVILNEGLDLGLLNDWLLLFQEFTAKSAFVFIRHRLPWSIFSWVVGYF